MAFTVAAVDSTSNILKGTAQVVIDILDVNDVSPITKSVETVVKVSEDAKVGQIVTVFHTVDPDTDTQSAGGIIYEMDGDLPFTIIKEGATSGYLVTSATLDMEHKSRYSIHINIKDRVQNIGNSLNIIVAIQDINDNNPVFTHSGMYQFNVAENNSTITTVGTVSANDIDVTQVNKEVRYSIVRGGHNNRIDIHPITGVITINGVIDFEQTKYFDFTVIATDTAIPDLLKRKVAESVIVTVTDVNDNKPKFTNLQDPLYVKENTPIGHNIFIVYATDEDSGDNGKISFSSTMTTPFNITSDGKIMVTSQLDYETRQASYSMIILAADAGTPSLSQVQTLSIKLVNVTDNNNDVSPVFEQKVYEFSLYENAPIDSFVTKLHATNGAGTVSNRNLLYSAVNLGTTPDFFFNTNGTVTVQRALDREVKDRYEYLVVATDIPTDVSEERQGSALLIINILDINDNTPSFSIYEYSVLISEKTPLTSSIFKFSATDSDRTSTISYAPISYSDIVWTLFQLDQSTGDVKVAGTLDYEKQSKYTMRIRASDNGTVPLVSFPSQLTIHIRDVAEGNSSIVFRKSQYSKQILETYPVNTEFLYVNAISKIISSNIRYLIEPDSANIQNKVAINASTGGISLKVSADFETERYMAFTVAAVDSTSNILKGTAQVVIDILDVNDVSPITKSVSTVVNVSEDAKVGQIVTVFHTVDPDTDTQSAGGIIY